MSNPYQIVILGNNKVTAAITKLASAHPELEIIAVKDADKRSNELSHNLHQLDSKTYFISSIEEVLEIDADCIIVTSSAGQSLEDLNNEVIALLESGRNVISTIVSHNPMMLSRCFGTETYTRIKNACKSGSATLYTIGLHPGSMVEPLVLNLSRAFTSIDTFRLGEVSDLSRIPNDFSHKMKSLGFGQTVNWFSSESPIFPVEETLFGDIISNIAYSYYGASNPDLDIQCDIQGIASKTDISTIHAKVKEGTVGALRITTKGFLKERHFITCEAYWYLGEKNAPSTGELVFNQYNKPLGYWIEINGHPTSMATQLEQDIPESEDSFATLSAQTLIGGIQPVCDASPGILINDSQPYYQHDHRL